MIKVEDTRVHIHERKGWTYVRGLVDAAEQSGALKRALNAHDVHCGAASRLVALGDQILLRATESKLRKGIQTRLHSVVDDPRYAAWVVTRDGNLALVFEYLGLDGYLRHHARPLSVHGKADVMRALMGELVESEEPVVLPWMECRKYSSKAHVAKALLRALIGTLLALAVIPASSRRHVDVDSKLVSLLRSGDIQSLVARCRMLHEASKPLFQRQLECTIANMLPQLNVMRLLVFVQALCLICREHTWTCAMERKSGKSLASSLASAVISAHLWQLPYDNIEQLNDVRESLDLTREESEQLVQLMVPVDFFEGTMEGSADGARFGITQKLQAPQLELVAQGPDTRGESPVFSHASIPMEGGPENTHTAYGDLLWQQTSKNASALETLHGNTPGGSQGLKDDCALVRTIDSTNDLNIIRSHEGRILSGFEGTLHHSFAASGEQFGAQDDYASQLGLAAAEFRRMAYATC